MDGPRPFKHIRPLPDYLHIPDDQLPVVKEDPFQIVGTRIARLCHRCHELGKAMDLEKPGSGPYHHLREHQVTLHNEMVDLYNMCESLLKVLHHEGYISHDAVCTLLDKFTMEY
jgi:hypothetical protein